MKPAPTTPAQPNPHYLLILKQLQQVIADFVIDEPENISSTLELEDSLGIDMDVAFPQLIMQINDHFDISLHPKQLAEDMDVITVADLALIISDETELG